MMITVCIPTLNAAASWQTLWSSLEMQALADFEVIVIDSASTDGTPELARESGCRVINIPRAEFRHGGTRQQAAELATTADVIVYLTQDSVLADPDALTRLVSAFEDPSVGATYGRQLPRPKATPIEAHARLFNYPPASSLKSLDSVNKLGFKAIFLSNSFAAYRQTALSQIGGFPRHSNFGEDTVVAARLLQAGLRIAYTADALAYHSHAYTHSEEWRRYYMVGQLHGTEPWLLRDFGQVSGEGLRFALSEIRFLSQRAPWLIPDAILRNGLKYLAYQQGRYNSQHHPPLLPARR